MKYVYVEPEVAGGLGQGTEMDTSVHPPVVRKLQYELERSRRLMSCTPSVASRRSRGSSPKARRAGMISDRLLTVGS